jgi:hypothetical protein
LMIRESSEGGGTDCENAVTPDTSRPTNNVRSRIPRVLRPAMSR